MVARDSPNLPRSRKAAWSSVLRTSSLPEARACSSARLSPVLQLEALRPITYWLPKLEIEPASIALLPVRWHNSRVRSWVSLSLAGLPINRRVSWTFCAGRTLRKGDCDSCTDRACFKASSKTASPVVLVKSARTIVSFSVSTGAGARERRYRPPTNPAMSSSAIGTTTFHNFLNLLLGCEGASAALTAPEDADAATVGEEPDPVKVAADCDPVTCATGTAPELATPTRPVSVL